MEELKNIIQRHTKDNKFDFVKALVEIEDMVRTSSIRIGSLEDRITAMEEAIAFFAKWWNETQDPDRKDKVNLLLPEHMVNDKKIIL